MLNFKHTAMRKKSVSIYKYSELSKEAKMFVKQNNTPTPDFSGIIGDFERELIEAGIIKPKAIVKISKITKQSTVSFSCDGIYSDKINEYLENILGPNKNNTSEALRVAGYFTLSEPIFGYPQIGARIACGWDGHNGVTSLNNVYDVYEKLEGMLKNKLDLICKKYYAKFLSRVMYCETDLFLSESFDIMGVEFYSDGTRFINLK